MKANSDFEEVMVPLHHDDLDTPSGIDWANTEIARVEPRKAPRIPRDTEPCHLWEFIAFGAGRMVVLVGLLWLAGWSFSKLLEVLP